MKCIVAEKSRICQAECPLDLYWKNRVLPILKNFSSSNKYEIIMAVPEGSQIPSHLKASLCVALRDRKLLQAVRVVRSQLR